MSKNILSNTINKEVVGFVARFCDSVIGDSGVNHILSSFQGAQKDLRKLFETSKYEEEIIGYGTVLDKMNIVVSDALKEYNDIFINELKKNNPGMRKKILLFFDLVLDRLENAPGKEIVSELGEFAKSSTGKEIESIIKESGIKNVDDDMMKLLVIIATRASIARAKDVEEEDGTSDEKKLDTKDKPEVLTPEAIVDKDGEEIKVDNSAHHQTEKKPETNGTPVDEPSTKEPESESSTEISKIDNNFNFNDFIDKIQNVNSEQELDDIISKLIRTAVLNQLDEFIKIVNNNTNEGVGMYQTILNALPADRKKIINGFNIDKLVTLLSSIVPCNDMSNEGLRLHFAVSAALSYRTIDWILNPDDVDKFLSSFKLLCLVKTRLSITTKSDYTKTMKLIADTENVWRSVCSQMPINDTKKDALFFMGDGALEVSAKATLITLFRKIIAA